ncbi:uncharacterized protein LOC133516559 [Cydia pomonella]|uniref:uncharacterized protein LOC133516559 n=1 Tax=Cydia pomonella TaxID=82600 RepID=UPI002ADD83F0|nr:uncharacterized protein LOC133516559 [Cydia pomonella]XP_061705533.1 uncharacterized protein LOC133516559 [Cydia pomonella]XP_061705535.1 uncharacterized protein LOC133516559 [Cydia pomonella]
MGVFTSKSPEYEPVLSHEFLCDALTKWYGQPAHYAHCFYLDDLSTSFTSEVVQWKVNTQFEENQHTYAELMLKHHPRNKTRGLSFRSADFFKNEINFYEKLLTELLEFQNSKEISGKYDNHVKLCFTHCDGKNDMICLQDVRTEGFKINEIIDIEHGKLILKTLARFHALSFAFKTENPVKYKTITKEITETYYDERFWSWYKKLWSQICVVAINAIENEYPNSIYVNKIREFAVPKRFKDLTKAVKQNNVILHGDCRSNNYLFKYINEIPVDVKMVDFQQVRCASPVLDVSSVIYSNEALLKDYEGLLKYYHGNLAIRIKELNGEPDVYTFDIFMEDVKKYSYFGLAFSFEAACTKLTYADITNKVCDEWICADVNKYKIVDIADAYEIKNLEKEDRQNLANSIVHCIDNDYI